MYQVNNGRIFNILKMYQNTEFTSIQPEYSVWKEYWYYTPGLELKQFKFMNQQYFRIIFFQQDWLRSESNFRNVPVLVIVKFSSLLYKFD